MATADDLPEYWELMLPTKAPQSIPFESLNPLTLTVPFTVVPSFENFPLTITLPGVFGA